MARKKTTKRNRGENVGTRTIRIEVPIGEPDPAKESGAFPHRMQLVRVGVLSALLLYMTPPVSAVFPLNVQLITLGLLLKILYIPPPLSA